jgi:circadian clock protein KaiC
MVATQHGVFTPQPADFDISYVADTVLVLRPFEHAGRVRTALSVHKRRAGSHEKTVRQFELRDGRMGIGSPLDKFSGVLAGDLRYHGDKLVSPEDP